MSLQSLRGLPPAKERLAHPSPDFAGKLSRTADLLRRIARDFSPAVQASSLGAEDVVLSGWFGSVGIGRHHQASAEQRQHAVRRLRGWQQDFAELATQK